VPKEDEDGGVPVLEGRSGVPICCLVLATEGGNGGLNCGTGGITLGCPLDLADALAGIDAGRETEGEPIEGARLGPYRLRLNSG
jgi:hypothetical protein